MPARMEYRWAKEQEIPDRTDHERVRRVKGSCGRQWVGVCIQSRLTITQFVLYTFHNYFLDTRIHVLDWSEIDS